MLNLVYRVRFYESLLIIYLFSSVRLINGVDEIFVSRTRFILVDFYEAKAKQT